jgi:hypothetical protein
VIANGCELDRNRTGYRDAFPLSVVPYLEPRAGLCGWLVGVLKGIRHQASQRVNPKATARETMNFRKHTILSEA